MLPLGVNELNLRGQVKPRFYINLEGTPYKEIYMPGDSKTCIEYHPQNEQSISFEDIVEITPNNRISSDPKTRIFMSGANEDYGLQFMDLSVKLGEKNFEINEYARATVINGFAVSLNEATHRSSGKYYLLNYKVEADYSILSTDLVNRKMTITENSKFIFDKGILFEWNYDLFPFPQITVAFKLVQTDGSESIIDDKPEVNSREADICHLVNGNHQIHVGVRFGNN